MGNSRHNELRASVDCSEGVVLDVIILNSRYVCFLLDQNSVWQHSVVCQFVGWLLSVPKELVVGSDQQSNQSIPPLLLFGVETPVFEDCS